MRAAKDLSHVEDGRGRRCCGGRKRGKKKIL